jgi:hypothetical protein
MIPRAVTFGSRFVSSTRRPRGIQGNRQRATPSETRHYTIYNACDIGPAARMMRLGIIAEKWEQSPRLERQGGL